MWFSFAAVEVILSAALIYKQRSPWEEAEIINRTKIMGTKGYHDVILEA